MPVTTTPYFFVHIMKTAGTTLRQHTRRNFPGKVYPAPHSDDMYEGYTSIQTLLHLPEQRKAQVVAYGGHYPYIVTELMGMDLLTMTLLRDPVDRTVSFLKQCKRMNEQHQDLPLEAIYEDSFFFPTLVHNHQTKVFSMAPTDQLETIYDVIEIDDARLEKAKANLSKVNLVGLSEKFDDFLEVLRSRYGWQLGESERHRESTEPWAASQSLRSRIAADNAADLEFYEFARNLCRGGAYVTENA